MTTIKNLSVCTYNMRGFNVTKVDYLKQLLVNCDILCNDNDNDNDNDNE